MAAHFGDLKSVEELLDRKANIDARDKVRSYGFVFYYLQNDNTALHFASAGNHFEVVKLLIGRKAEYSIANAVSIH